MEIRSESPNTIQYSATRKEAVAFIKKQPSGTKFALHVRGTANLMNDAERVFLDGCSSAMNISRVQAAKLAETLITNNLEERGGRIPISVYTTDGYRCVWLLG